jgi:hypothetical protein
MAKLNTKSCECEHVSHFDKKKRSPAGNPNHRYGTKFAESFITPVKTPYGTFHVCDDCAKDCLAISPLFKKNPRRRLAYPLPYKREKLRFMRKLRKIRRVMRRKTCVPHSPILLQEQHGRHWLTRATMTNMTPEACRKYAIAYSKKHPGKSLRLVTQGRKKK